jgi:hypothetical protein
MNCKLPLLALSCRPSFAACLSRSCLKALIICGELLRSKAVDSGGFFRLECHHEYLRTLISSTTQPHPSIQSPMIYQPCLYAVIVHDMHCNCVTCPSAVPGYDLTASPSLREFCVRKHIRRICISRVKFGETGVNLRSRERSLWHNRFILHVSPYCITYSVGSTHSCLESGCLESERGEAPFSHHPSLTLTTPPSPAAPLPLNLRSRERSLWHNRSILHVSPYCITCSVKSTGSCLGSGFGYNLP